MKKLLARVLCLTVSAVALFSSANVAQAKVYNYDITEDNFPAADYSARYGDVKAAFGEDKAALYKHYQVFGAEEGRIVKITDEILKSQVNADTPIVASKVFALTVLPTIVNDDMTDAQKVKAVEAWMQANITYGVSKDNSCYHIVGPMISGPTTDEGYAETFEFFMDALGIEAITNSDLKSNKVNVDGVWYNVNIPAGVLY